MGTNAAGSYGPACSFNPLATSGPLATTTGSSVFSFGGINLGVEDIPISAKTCAYPFAGNTACTAGVAQNNSLLSSAASQSKIVEYVAIGLLGVGLWLLYRHFSK